MARSTMDKQQDPLQPLRHALRHPKVLAADGWYTHEDDRFAATDREFIAACQPSVIAGLLAERDELAARLAQIAAQPPERPPYPFNVPLGERSLRRVHCRLNPELLDHFEDERWKRIAENAQAVTTGGDDKGDYFEVPAHLMAALALALDEWPGAQGQAGAASMGTKIRPAAAPERADDSPRPAGWKAVPVDPTPEMIDAADSVDWRDDDTRGSAINMWHCMLAVAPEQAEPVGGCSDSVSCPRGER